MFASNIRMLHEGEDRTRSGLLVSCPFCKLSARTEITDWRTGASAPKDELEIMAKLMDGSSTIYGAPITDPDCPIGRCESCGRRPINVVVEIVEGT